MLFLTYCIENGFLSKIYNEFSFAIVFSFNSQKFKRTGYDFL